MFAVLKKSTHERMIPSTAHGEYMPAVIAATCPQYSCTIYESCRLLCLGTLMPVLPRWYTFLYQ